MEKKKLPNYIVVSRGHLVSETIECKTKKEVWDAIGKGWSYTVSSPIGLDVTEFIPF